MRKTFIEKYKPRVFRDFHFAQDGHVDGAPIDDGNPGFMMTLNCLLKMDRIHTLFLGPPDSYKTVFLFAFLREYYQTESSLPEKNILFINNLKEQGINYYRHEMKIFCQSYSVVPGKKKFVVIDDLDCITEQSQQVFRSYLDKYGHNFHFISVCSSIQKVIESMQSRLLFVKLPRLERRHLSFTLQTTLQKEQLQMDPAAKEFLLNLCGHSIRPLFNHLEKIRIIMNHHMPGHDEKNTRVSLSFCQQVCTDINPLMFVDYIQWVKKGETRRAWQILFDIHSQGFSVVDILDYLFDFVKSLPSHGDDGGGDDDVDDDSGGTSTIISSSLMTEKEKYEVIPFLCKYITTFHNLHEDKIELAFFTQSWASSLANTATTTTTAQ
jgi:hypothetical protein